MNQKVNNQLQCCKQWLYLLDFSSGRCLVDFIILPPALIDIIRLVHFPNKQKQTLKFKPT